MANHRFLSSLDDPAFPEVLRIYHAAFDRETREPDERLAEELRGEFRLPFRLLVAESAADVVAFARFCRLPKTAFGFLIHIAVDKDLRGAGVGSELLKAVLEGIAPAPLLVEIEHAGRVHNWYVRHGFRKVTATYTLPALHADTEPVPFALYASGQIGDPEACIRALYEDAWQLGPDHPFVVKACAGID